ncbi:cellulose biosynthesis cyclic di-GMP-binding regulatory protein BcsB [Ferrovum myxofaciens]|uniref:Cyclic di-GMP-binding protein n=2 Tax=Ferrovum myxofaciens TaxID=416213 RepID=A0A9E6MXV7_9PROT|nr:cellulose biosynthesis cyclic di-GMP-binding regulatory protein BcsB [Ferrovum myxofaciens]QKE37934.1 MAG: cellulose biosynthesis cyclic di-GMP-binding regulatory protein BcsB [Ferrovum myxofaciens]QWY78362.1 MAG: cellulose biosynthesis cyclic di-GMP-binding regulatory protein BcsB [Ferrovum myxofaciens]
MEVKKSLAGLFFFLFGTVVHAATLVSSGPETREMTTRESVIHYPLYKLGEDEDQTGDVFKLRSTEGILNFSFGTRMDQVVERAVFHLKFNYSPALIPIESHIKILLNNEVVKVVSIPKEYSSIPLSIDVPLDPRLITDYNRLELVFIGHYTNDQCEDPLNTTLWADVDSNSDLEMTVAQIPLKNDLGLLPAPFFDSHDNTRLDVPFVFPDAPGLSMMQAAGIVSSWLGKLADWRGSIFPVSMNQVPPGNAVVFATNTVRPGFLHDHPNVNGPVLEIMTNPSDGVSRLLVIFGRNDKDLHTAALALALGHSALSGQLASVVEVKEEDPRKAYDAPRWVRLDRSVKLGELVDTPDKLQVYGLSLLPIRIHMRVAPDVFAWRSQGVPVELKYRYTPPHDVGESRLVMSINHQLVQAFNLRASNEAEDQKIRLPLMDNAVLSGTDQLLIPPYKMWSRDTLSFRFSFAHHKESLCRDTQVGSVRAAIDPDSTIDLSGYPHYAEMPNLSSFATLGFPFTKFADLQETTVVVPNHPTPSDIESMLTILAHLGADTGYPATRYQLVFPGDTAALKDHDVLVIGRAIQEGELQLWKDHMPAVVDSSGRLITQSKRSVNLFYDWLGFDTKPDPDVASMEKYMAGGQLAILTEFESPVTRSRSVISLSAVDDSSMSYALDAIDDPALFNNIRGSVSFIHPHRVDSALVGKIYTIGYLPLWTSIWYPLSMHPILIMILGIFVTVIVAILIWKALRSLAANRMGE